MKVRSPELIWQLGPATEVASRDSLLVRLLPKPGCVFASVSVRLVKEFPARCPQRLGTGLTGEAGPAHHWPRSPRQVFPEIRSAGAAHVQAKSDRRKCLTL